LAVLDENPFLKKMVHFPSVVKVGEGPELLSKMRPNMGKILLGMGLDAKIKPPPLRSGFEFYLN
jgi:hypothetical protein